MKEVIYLNESDRPKQEKPLSFTEFAEKKCNGISRNTFNDQKWSDSCIDKIAKEYHEYLTNFKTDEKPVEFTHYGSTRNGWEISIMKPSDYPKIVYLGVCKLDGDIFAAYCNRGGIDIYKGHLNSGKY